MVSIVLLCIICLFCKSTGQVMKPNKISGEGGKPPLVKVKASNPGAKAKKQEANIPADDILNLVQDLEPGAQGLLHRFSLRLTVKILSGIIPWLLIAIVMLVVALVLVTVMKSSSVEIVAIDERGRIMHVTPRDTSDYTNAQVINWANDTLLDIFDINYKNYTRNLEKVTNSRFTSWGKKELQNTFKSIISELIRTKGILSIEGIEGEAMKFTGRRKNGDGYIWTVDKKVKIVLSPLEGPPTINIRTVTMQIYQVDDWKSDKGLAVNQLVQIDK